MSKTIKYKSEVKTIMLGGKPAKLINRTPILTPEEREKRKREIETQLYNVFSKYQNSKNET